MQDFFTQTVDRPTIGRVHVVDDDESMAKALRRVLEPSGFAVSTYGSAADFLGQRVQDLQGCALIDIHLPEADGFAIQTELARREAPLSVVFLTSFASFPACVRAMTAGATDFLKKPVPGAKLLAAVNRALEKSKEAQALAVTRQSIQARLSALTAAERRVLDGMVSGKLNKTIGFEVGAAERTVKAHRSSVMRKMECRSLAEVVHMWDTLLSTSSGR